MSEVWMSTYSGKKVFLLAPRLEDIDIEDIAHHLSMLCRWVGSLREFYSVAQHCVHVAQLCPPEAQPYALLHDAFEAYGGDVNARLKASPMMQGYRALEAIHQAKIFQRFGLAGAMPEEIEMVVHHADLTVRALEAQDLRVHPIPDYQAVARPTQFMEPIRPWTPPYAKEFFLRSFEKVIAQHRGRQGPPAAG